MSDKRTRRTFTTKQKLAILAEAVEHGVTVTLEKHAIYAATYYSWRRKLAELGEQGLQHGMSKQQLKRIRELEAQNRKLKELLGQKELEAEMQQELLKKKYPNHYSNKS